jgi:hypothetical protein
VWLGLGLSGRVRSGRVWVILNMTWSVTVRTGMTGRGVARQGEAWSKRNRALMPDSQPTQHSHSRRVSRRVMTPKRALTLAVKLCRLELRRMAFDRNAYRLYGARYPEAVKAWERSEELAEVVRTLDGLRSELD